MLTAVNCDAITCFGTEQMVDDLKELRKKFSAADDAIAKDIISNTTNKRLCISVAIDEKYD
ncbi:MAG: hypothetical protein LBI39_02685 [Puniceicoccales bacterium]|nr:hypothetical protein [Puniceicoccales bacterium]